MFLKITDHRKIDTLLYVHGAVREMKHDVFIIQTLTGIAYSNYMYILYATFIYHKIILLIQFLRNTLNTVLMI